MDRNDQQILSQQPLQDNRWESVEYSLKCGVSIINLPFIQHMGIFFTTKDGEMHLFQKGCSWKHLEGEEFDPFPFHSW